MCGGRARLRPLPYLISTKITWPQRWPHESMRFCPTAHFATTRSERLRSQKIHCSVVRAMETVLDMLDDPCLQRKWTICFTEEASRITSFNFPTTATSVTDSTGKIIQCAWCSFGYNLRLQEILLGFQSPLGLLEYLPIGRPLVFES